MINRNEQFFWKWTLPTCCRANDKKKKMFVVFIIVFFLGFSFIYETDYEFFASISNNTEAIPITLIERAMKIKLCGKMIIPNG